MRCPRSLTTLGEPASSEPAAAWHWGPGAGGLTCDVEQLHGPHLSQMAKGRLLGAVRRTKHWVSEGLLVISQTISPGGLPSRLCAVLSANSCPCLLLSSLRHLWPLQLRQHPSSEHRGWRVDDVSSPCLSRRVAFGACGFLAAVQTFTS